MGIGRRGVEGPPGTVLAMSGHPAASDPWAATPARKEVTVEFMQLALQAGPAGADGILEARVPPAPQEYALRVERIVIHTDSSAGTTCTVYVGEPSAANRVDYSPTGNSDVAEEGGGGVFVPGGSPLTIRWEGASVGALGYARVQYRVVALVPMSARQAAN